MATKKFMGSRSLMVGMKTSYGFAVWSHLAGARRRYGGVSNKR